MTTIAKPTNDRDEAIAIIRAELKRRTGRTWSVKGGRGTSWGWIQIDAPPARCLAVHKLKAGHQNNGTEDWEEVVSPENKGRGHMTPEDRAILAKALGLDSVHYQGVSIAASSDYRNEYIARAKGQTPAKIAQPYWD